MKKVILLLVSLVLTGTMMARQLTPDEALALAMGKMNAAQTGFTRALSADAYAASLTHTELNGQDVPLYYVFNIAEGGFIIASADDRASCLLGYTDSGDFAGAQQNQSFLAWLNDCRKALTHIGSMPEPIRSMSAETRALTTSVSPLLGEIMWNQKAPYNLLTPLRVGKKDAEAEPDTVHAPTGCVATAVAQVMMYYQWPATGTGSHTNVNDSLQTIDFSQSTYQWSKMLPAYKGGESEESQMAVAQLMNDVGCAVEMLYGYASSGAWDNDILNALANHFGYDKRMRLVYRTLCSSEEWNHLLMTELNEKRPVICSGTTPLGGGHEYVIDGYDTNGLYHVNWGWGGMANGYFDINLMDPHYQGIGGYAGGYTLGQAMVLGIKPDKEGTSVAKPELVVYQHFNFDGQTQQWTYTVSNYSLGDFTGEVGVAMESPTGEVTKLTSGKYNADPILFYQFIDYSFEPPVVSDPGYKLYPYYCDVIDGAMKRIPTPYNSFSTLVSVEQDGVLGWTIDLSDVADVEILGVEVKHNFVGFDPQLNITLSNSSASVKEYIDDLRVQITTMVDGEKKLVSTGYVQAFIEPGETKELVVRCSMVEEEFKDKIVEGEYTYTLSLWVGGVYYTKDSASFEMVNVPPSDITYSDFAVNKTEFLPDEELVASMTVTNTGGYDMKTLDFAIFRESENTSIDVITLQDADIEPESSKSFTLSQVLTYGPGVYEGLFYVNDEKLKDAPRFRFTIIDPTALDKITSAPDSDVSSAIYDLQGRPVQQVRRGEVFIGKSKFVVK